MEDDEEIREMRRYRSDSTEYTFDDGIMPYAYK